MTEFFLKKRKFDCERTVVVIGGTSGMGLATAQVLSSEGYRVIISGRSQDTINKALSQVFDPKFDVPFWLEPLRWP
ncbi:SDR family NAD(P)-dependent oxidoreductase [Nostoc sp. UHCC 0926]|uniref:SDR family NAD(P)-dependent oxidoreductase n=1 Tax=unclassified Nostoc TaxID=2593658 RepID=UPI0023604E16|nr:SDR family NAD(P)-dependent oxidoreductase [Nostoc sp. UHCC 0926]WDD30881.1 SDR family NAD(P)-dependent oxidoreductase [Nostoc sp. UHCC 0926]